MHATGLSLLADALNVRLDQTDSVRDPGMGAASEHELRTAPREAQVLITGFEVDAKSIYARRNSELARPCA
jgi:hypothetical protein